MESAKITNRGEDIVSVLKRTDTIIFDIGNVLLAYDWRSYLQEFDFSPEVFRIIAEAVFLNEDWERGDQGGITSRQWEELFLENAPGYEKEIRQVFDGLSHTIRPLPYTTELTEGLKRQGYRLFYLSNYSEHLYYATKHLMGFLDIFDGGIFSYKAGCIKPDRHIYRLLLETYSISPYNALFLDDREENVKAALDIGLNGAVFTSETPYHILEYLRSKDKTKET